ncbi:MAG TPA: YceD family protein [Pseudomonadales bacterium]|nr:YceD family protein [Pseudomonadales bacterium]
MSLKVNLRHLEEHGIHLEGDLPVAELDLGLQDEMMQAKKPLHYDLQVEEVANGLLVQGKLDLTLDCQCVRCLKPIKQRVELPQWTLHLPLEGEEKVSVDNDCVDLTPFVREDMLLEFPQHPACKPDCAGLKKNGRDNAEKAKKAELSPSAWKEDLDKLNF